MFDTHAAKKASAPVPQQKPTTFFGSVPRVQRQPATDKDDKNNPAAVANLLTSTELEEAGKDNIKKLGRYSRERYLVSLFLHVPFQVTDLKATAGDELEDIIPLTVAIAVWQYNYTNDTNEKYKKEKSSVKKVNGKYADTMQALKENSFDPAGKKENWNWNKKDQEDAIAVLEAEKKQKEALADDSENAKRQAVVDLALTQAGTIASIDRGDGAKIGWERIARYYEVAQNNTDQFKRKRNDKGEPVNEVKVEESGLKTNKIEGIKAANTFAYKGRQNTDWSWCGIFAVWAIRTITGKGTWNAGPKGFGGIKTDIRNAKKGDIINIKISSNPLNHHFILAQDISPSADDSYIVLGIEGNIALQGVKATHRWKLGDVAGYYNIMS